MSKVLKNFVGMDISKSWFDAAVVLADEPNKAVHQQFTQSIEGFRQFNVWLKEQGVTLDDATLFCMENTGIYSTALVEFLVSKNLQVWVEMPLRIKRAGGFERSTDDKLAAIKIAYYALRHQDQAQYWRPLQSNLEKLKLLITQRDRIMDSINQLIVPVNELKEAGLKKEADQMEKIQRAAINSLKKAKAEIEVLILKTINQDNDLNQKIQRIQSIDGIGPVTAVALLVFTKGFTAFENAKQLACYCGVVPFSKSSGTSVRYKPSVSSFANKKLKKLLHMCALSAVNNNQDLKAYFERKVAEGKNKMSVLNAVRNKLLHRVFAMVRDERFYVENYTRACV
jgi:transposase